MGIGDPNTGHRRSAPNYPAENPQQPGDTTLDDCVFSLYRYILTDDQISVDFDSSTWERIGTYSSGTLLDNDGNPYPGQFLTNLDTGINDNYVYVLVEDNVGPNGCIINPYYQYTFWYSGTRTNKPVKCYVNSSEITRTFTYTMDTVNHTDLLNSWEMGPGEGNILLASLRLTKWFDTYDENGNRKQIYNPLYNVDFEVRLANADNTLIAELTTHKDNHETPEGVIVQDLAFAQTGVFQLVFGTGENEGKIYLVEYEVPGENPKQYNVTDIVTMLSDPDHPDYNIYGIKVNIKETHAPDGYGYSHRTYETYLIFVDKDPDGTGNKFRFYSDLYFVKTTETTIHLAEAQEGRLWHATEAVAENAYVLGDPLQRIVDYPITNTMVQIYKYGYAPTAATVELALASSTADDYSYKIATGNYGAVPLSGVTMTLERYDEESGTWKAWDFAADDWGSKPFVTELGTYYFQNGLPMGKYRVYETDMGTQAAEYENAYLKADGHYREFTVGGVPVDVYMANPEKIDLTITKKNMADNSAVTGMTFKLGSLTAVEFPLDNVRDLT